MGFLEKCRSGPAQKVHFYDKPFYDRNGPQSRGTNKRAWIAITYGIELAMAATWDKRDSEGADCASARKLQEEVLESHRHLLGEEHPDTLMAMSNVAVTLRAQGDLAGARKLNEQVLSIRRRLLGEEHPDTLTAMAGLAATLYKQGDLAGARELQEQVLEARRRLLGEEHPDTAEGDGESSGNGVRARGPDGGAEASGAGAGGQPAVAGRGARRHEHYCLESV